MANQKEIRARISSTISTQQITKAMKLVSATKLRKASEAIVRMRPYAEKLQGIMGNLKDSTEDDRLAGYFEAREAKKVLLLVITSDRGLCGAFNANVVKRVKVLLDTDYRDAYKAGNVTLMCMGKKGGEALKRFGYEVNLDRVNLTQNTTAESAFEAMQGVINQFLAGEYDRVEVVYNKFKNAATQILVNEKLLPISASASEASQTNNDYLFEPGKVATFFMDLIWALPPTRDTEIPTLIAGRIPELNKFDSKKICPSVIEITLVGIYAETSPACVSMIGNAVKEPPPFTLPCKLTGKSFMLQVI